MGKDTDSGFITVDMTATNRLPARGLELMRVVTRFEYALKEIGYGRPGKNGEVDVDWDGFANTELKAAFFKRIQENAVAPTLLSKPPSKQILTGKTLDWEEGSPPTSVQDLFGAMRRVRNNLVHGGKSGDKDSDRNDKLVSESIDVLTEALRTHADLRFMFEGKW
ncbi:hypothetical protein [Mesorhizobium sp. M0047]|uniref:hypothetical protein n=1 Tax=Mesorhizobium sp. M0047 TaxID=2956859 RepID=UPI003339C9D2